MNDTRAHLPPPFEQFEADLRADRKRLLRDSNFRDANQLRAFVGQYLYPRMIEMFRMLGEAFVESFSLTASNMNELRRLHYFTVTQLQEMGVDVEEDAHLPGVSPEVMDDFQHAFYAIGTAIQQERPHEEIGEAYERCASLVSEMVGQLMGFYSDDEIDDEAPLDDDADDEANDEAEDADAEGEDADAEGEDANEDGGDGN